uniref:Hexosyltransferase n=1 Tax=Megaselia scalaris TaxID=36166 RepID=T1H127_MEGSC
MYRMNSESKGDKDPFRDIKQLALNLSTKFKNDGSRIAWVSTRLPASFSGSSTTEDVMLSSIYSTNGILSIAAADLALPKIGLETLVLMASNSMTFKADFLNRVRMNTIQGYQIFSPIGFLMYPCKFAGFCKECESCDVSQSTGYFDRTNYDVVSFYRNRLAYQGIDHEVVPVTYVNLLRNESSLSKPAPAIPTPASSPYQQPVASADYELSTSPSSCLQKCSSLQTDPLSFEDAKQTSYETGRDYSSDSNFLDSSVDAPIRNSVKTPLGPKIQDGKCSSTGKNTCWNFKKNGFSAFTVFFRICRILWKVLS